MKIKNKGKVHPSPPSRGSLQALQVLPAAIISLISVLSFEDREVLAYMIARSISSSQDNYTKSKKLMQNNNRSNYYGDNFDCDCFDCYRSYWFKWDSSPNRELIHQAIEAFEDHLATPKKKTNRRHKSARRLNAPKPPSPPPPPTSDDVITESISATREFSEVGVSSVPEAVRVPECHVEAEKEEEVGALVVRAAAAAVSEHKGLVRKVLPDVMGLFNSRLWSLWSPNA